MLPSDRIIRHSFLLQSGLCFVGERKLSAAKNVVTKRWW